MYKAMKFSWGHCMLSTISKENSFYNFTIISMFFFFTYHNVSTNNNLKNIYGIKNEMPQGLKAAVSQIRHFQVKVTNAMENNLENIP